MKTQTALILFFLFGLTQFNWAKNINEGLLLKSELRGRVSQSKVQFADDEKAYFNIELKLVNNTCTKIYYDIVNCFWFRNFITSRDFVRIYPDFCDKNDVQTMSLNPKQERSFNTTIGINRSLFKGKKSSFRIGFILVKPNNYNDLSRRYDKYVSEVKERAKNKQNIIWSNQIELDISRNL